jgi:hypothetical protein
LPRFKYKEKESGIFGKIKRPLIDLKVFSPNQKKWILLSEVLADTGADISILPKAVGESIIGDITKGRYLEIRGVTPLAFLGVFIHNLKCKIGNIIFKSIFAIADSDDVPPILGRVKGLDLFTVIFKRGKEINL